MSLVTIEEVAQRAGTILRVVDENVGTGDNAKVDFDLANDQVIEGTLVLSHAADGSNTFTPLVLTTDFTIDLESGRIVLTTSGRDAVDEDIIFATYGHLAKLTLGNVQRFIDIAENRLIEDTGKDWAERTITEFHDGERRSDYPMTDRPFQRDRPTFDSLTLRRFPVKEIKEVWFLDRRTDGFGSVLSDDGGVFTDNTDAAADPDGVDFNVFAAVPAIGDIIYFGHPNIFLGLRSILRVPGVDGGALAMAWEFFDGSSFVPVTNLTPQTTGVDLFTADGFVNWDRPPGWEKTSVNGSSDLFFVRARITAGSYSTSPTMWESYSDPDQTIEREISLRNVDVRPTAKLVFLNELILQGVRNVRVKYLVGADITTPKYALALDLITVYAALMSAVAITGGSFDDETSFTLGAKSVTIGEVYVNVAEVVKQLSAEIVQLKKLVGDRVSVA